MNYSSWKIFSSHGLNTLGPLCLWQCFFKPLIFWSISFSLCSRPTLRQTQTLPASLSSPPVASWPEVKYGCLSLGFFSPKTGRVQMQDCNTWAPNRIWRWWSCTGKKLNSPLEMEGEVWALVYQILNRSLFVVEKIQFLSFDAFLYFRQYFGGIWKLVLGK